MTSPGLVLLALAAAFAAEPGATLVVDLTGFSSDEGAARVSVFASDEGFPSDRDRAVRAERVPITGGLARAVFTGLPPGTYAVTAFHDEDDDGRLDRIPLGPPLEDYGASNDARRVFGPPAFDDAAFVLGEAGHTIGVRVH